MVAAFRDGRDGNDAQVFLCVDPWRSTGGLGRWGDQPTKTVGDQIVGVLRTIFTLQFLDMTLTWVRTSRGGHRKCDDSGDEELSSWQTPGICHFSQQD